MAFSAPSYKGVQNSLPRLNASAEIDSERRKNSGEGTNLESVDASENRTQQRLYRTKSREYFHMENRSEKPTVRSGQKSSVNKGEITTIEREKGKNNARNEVEIRQLEDNESVPDLPRKTRQETAPALPPKTRGEYGDLCQQLDSNSPVPEGSRCNVSEKVVTNENAETTNISKGTTPSKPRRNLTHFPAEVPNAEVPNATDENRNTTSPGRKKDNHWAPPHLPVPDEPVVAAQKIKPSQNSGHSSRPQPTSSRHRTVSQFPPPPSSPTSSSPSTFRSSIEFLPSSTKRQGLRQQILISSACSLAPLTCGFAMAYNVTQNPNELFGTHTGAWRTYVYLLGCLGGGCLSGISLNFGRKKTTFMALMPFSLLWFLVIFANEIWMLLTFHAFSGAFTGVLLVVSQIYSAEISSPNCRGTISLAPILAFQIGALVCYSLGETLNWKHLAIVGASMNIPIILIIMFCMVESPRFLITNKPTEAMATLQWLRGVSNDVTEEYNDITDGCEVNRWRFTCEELIRPTFWRPLIISCGLMFFYTMTGVASFGLYGVELFAEVSTSYTNVAHFVLTTVLIISILLAAFLVDRIGRKLLLLLSLTLMTASAFVLGLFLFLKDLHRVESYFEHQWIGETFCVILFTFAQGTGVAPVTWITLGEVWPTQHKWLGVTAASLVLWSSTLAVDVVFQKLRSFIATGGLFWCHCVVCVAGYIFVLVVFRELKEQKLDYVSAQFVKKHEKLMETFFAKVI